MKKLSQIALVVAALAIFATGFQAKHYNVNAGSGGKVGEVPVVTG